MDCSCSELDTERCANHKCGVQPNFSREVNTRDPHYQPCQLPAEPLPKLFSPQRELTSLPRLTLSVIEPQMSRATFYGRLHTWILLLGILCVRIRRRPAYTLSLCFQNVIVSSPHVRYVILAYANIWVVLTLGGDEVLLGALQPHLLMPIELAFLLGIPSPREEMAVPGVHCTSSCNKFCSFPKGFY